ncbi:hypothetical protein FA15DRAFT_669093 [Coprinopsis marcescibilis]|uniref:Kinase-like protein n=1 Tax=Coprinopsis marcescibilis TaxID=230819 RepID=A0A5C3KX15_COPMA|nr:hypothetical protein FA15DRAFT_669093 [Coprinopsis marcescibilis]
MASGTSASAPLQSNFSSRFSTLKAFKFGSREGNGKPPPPPPKDDYYLRNRSMASLSPDAFSLPPNSPLSPRHNMYTSQTSPDPNQSTMSLASSVASGAMSTQGESKSRPQSRGKERLTSFLRIGRRSPKSPPSRAGTADELDAGPPQEDGSISMPFNFQHNIHVDDGLVGLPPTWSTALSQAGFTDDEIIAIQTRRAVGSRSPNSQYLLNTRPPSPSIRHPYLPNQSGTPAASSLITQPVPRTSSLPRQVSDTSLRSSVTQQRPSIPYAMSSSTSVSTASLHSSQASSISNIKSIRATASQDQSLRQHTPQLSVSYSSDSHSSSALGSEDNHQSFRTGPFSNGGSPPPRNPIHSNNSSISQSYTSHAPSLLNGHTRNESAASSKRYYGSQPNLTSVSAATPSRLAGDNGATSTIANGLGPSQAGVQATTLESSAARPGKRTGALPPRLSLHSRTDSSDLSSWAGALLSGISSDLEEKLKLNPPTSPQSAPPTGTAPALSARPPQTLSLQGKPPRPPPSRPLPPIVATRETLPEQDEPDSAQYALSPPWVGGQANNSPLWSELEGMLVQPNTSGTNAPAPYSAALNDSFSPTLPFTPEEERMATERKLRTERSREELHRDEEEDEDDDYLRHSIMPDDINRLSVNTARPNRDSSRSSTSTITTTIVRKASVVRRTAAHVIAQSPSSLPPTPSIPHSMQPHRPQPIELGPTPSPLSSSVGSGSEESMGSGSTSQTQDYYSTPDTAYSLSSPLNYYLESSPSPHQTSFSPAQPLSKEYPEVPPYDIDELEEEEDDDENTTHLIVPHQIITAPSPGANRPTIVIDEVTPGGLSAGFPTGTPHSPYERYGGWLSKVLQPLIEYIDEGVDPRDHYVDLKEIAEGESGSVFSARLTERDAHKLRLPPLVKAKDIDDFNNGRTVLVAIKSVTIVPTGSPKLEDLQHELSLMKGLGHENIIGLDGLYMDFLEDTLWIRMELMERSLADVLSLVDQGLMLQDRMMARFASDILHGLEYLEKHFIAHRDVRSDNLLVNKHGVLKITDFSSAVQVTEANPMETEPAGVLYWQAPEIRSPPYNAMKVDVWSLGATVWEMAEIDPPFADSNLFADRWPSVSQPEIYSPAFHEFLHLCSEPAAVRPTAGELLKTPFVKNACGRAVIFQLLSQCISIETPPE